MTWVRLDDNFDEWQIWEEVGPVAMAMHVAALGYCNRGLTDGEISRGRAMRLLPIWDGVDPAQVVDSLVKHGLWKDAGGGKFRIVDYLETQPSREEVEKRRAAEAERQRNYRAAKANGIRHSVTPTVTPPATPTATTPREYGHPDPTRPDP